MVGEQMSLADVERELAQVEGLAARMLQRVVRGYLCRRRLWDGLVRDVKALKAQEQVELQAAALVIQRLWRGGAARRGLWNQLGEAIAQNNASPKHSTAPQPVTPVRSPPFTPVKLPAPDRATDSGDRRSRGGDDDISVEERIAKLCSPGVLSESYCLGSVIGTGANSTVRQARCCTTGQDYAVKSLLKSTVDREAVLRECTIMAQLAEQPGVLQLVALYDSGTSYDFVLEYMQGGDLFGIMLETAREKHQSRKSIAPSSHGSTSRTRSKKRLRLNEDDQLRAAAHIHKLVPMSGADSELVRQVVQSMFVTSFDPGELIIEHGEMSSAFYIIRSGVVDFTRMSTLRLGSQGVGSWFGDLGLLRDDNTTTATAHAGQTEGCTCFVLEKEHFDVLLKQILYDRHAQEPASSNPASSSNAAPPQDQSGTFTEVEAASFVRQIAEAVATCHAQNIVHRDLKPENILLPRISGDAIYMSAIGRNLNLRLKLADFGLATVVAPNEKLYAACGTPEFVAPEVVSLVRPGYGKPADIWSLGVLLYILLCGYPPFASVNDTLRGELEFADAEWTGASAEVKQLLRSMLSRDPSSRPTADDLCNNLWVSGRVRGQEQAIIAPNVIRNIARWNAKRKIRAAFHAMVAGRRMGVLVAGLTVEKLVVDLAVQRRLTDVRALVKCFENHLAEKETQAGIRGGIPSAQSMTLDRDTFVRLVSCEWSAGAIDRHMTPTLAEEHFDAFCTMEQVKAARAAVEGGDNVGHSCQQGCTTSETTGSVQKRVNWLSYCLALASLLPSIESEEKLTFAFELFDRDKSGAIDKREFHALVQCLLVGKHIDSQNLDVILSAEFEAADVSGDGSISLTEFLTAAQRQPMIQRYFGSLEGIARHTKQVAILRVQSFLRGWLVRKKYGRLIRDLWAQKRELQAKSCGKQPLKLGPEPEPEPATEPAMEPTSAPELDKTLPIQTLLCVQAAARGWLARKHLAAHLEAELQALELQVLKENGLDRVQMEAATAKDTIGHDGRPSNIRVKPSSAPSISFATCDTSDAEAGQLQASLAATQQEAAETQHRAVVVESQLSHLQPQNSARLQQLQDELVDARASARTAQAEAASYQILVETQLTTACHKLNEQGAALQSALGTLQRLRAKCAQALAESSRTRCELVKALEAERAAKRDVRALRNAERERTRELAVAQASAAALEKRLHSIRHDQTVQTVPQNMHGVQVDAEGVVLQALHDSIDDVFEGFISSARERRKLASAAATQVT